MRVGRTLAIITARGGSKGLPRKNILETGGKPLIAWTIEAAMGSSVIDQVILSSEDEEIIETAKTWGCSVPFRRPDNLATDTATSIDVVMHAIEQLPEFDYVVLLQPTSPLRTAADIDAAFYQLEIQGAPSCVSVCEAEQSPYLMYLIGERQQLNRLLPPPSGLNRRQDLPTAYILNGAIYIARIDWLRKTKNFISSETVAHVMRKDNSLDIDTPEDFDRFRAIIRSSVDNNEFG